VEAEYPGRRAWPMAPSVSAEPAQEAADSPLSPPTAADPTSPAPFAGPAAPIPATAPFLGPMGPAAPIPAPIPATAPLRADASGSRPVPADVSSSRPVPASRPAPGLSTSAVSTSAVSTSAVSSDAPLPGRSRRRVLAVPLITLAVAAVLAGTVVAVRQARHDGSPPQAVAARTAAPVASAAGADGALGAPGSSPSVLPGPSGAAVSRSAAPGAVPVDPNLLAVEDFTGTAPNEDRWGLYQSTADNGALWQRSALQVSGGQLHIVATGRNPTGAGNIAGGLCWCGTGGNRLYGIWKVRARFDAGAGYGPVIGLWPETDTGNDGMINFGAPEANRGTLHTTVAGNNGAWVADTRKIAANLTGWHTYTVEWRATAIRMYLDSRLVYASSTSTGTVFLPHTQMHLIIQVNEGPTDSVPAANSSTPDRVVTYIDWVRMYR
jgi:hypothetical protein